MAELTHTNLAVHLMTDAEHGLAHFMAEVEGALIPIATQKLGHLEAMIASANRLSVKAPGAKPADPAPVAPVAPAQA